MINKEYLDKHEKMKQFIHWLLISPRQARPRWWVRWFVNPLVHKRHRSSLIRSSARMDVVPFRAFQLGAKSAIEDFCVVNNGVGDVSVGSESLVGIGSVVIGPVHIGSNVIIAQHVVLSGLNHAYEDIDTPIWKQPVTTKQITIEDECWIGANALITAGVTIGRHSVVAGGSVVTRDVPPYAVVGGNPARVLKQYNASSRQWLKPSSLPSKPLETVE